MPRRNHGPRLRFLDKRGCYYIVWTQRGRSRERSTSTADFEEAKRKLAEFIISQGRRSGPRDPSEILITDVLSNYAEQHAQETASPWRIVAGMKPLVDFWEGNFCSDISKATCRRYTTSRERSEGTVRRELGILRSAINYAVREGVLTRSVHVELPAKPPPRDRFLTRAEFAALLRAALREPRVRLHLPLFLVLGVYTGQRKEAVLSLRWPQVDLSRGIINFNPPDRKVTTNKRRSVMPIPPPLLSHLRRARLRGSDLGYVIHENGERLRDIKKGFGSACSRAGLTGVVPHTLRHTCATWLMQSGVPLWEASQYLAMSHETLERVYAHAHPDFLKEASLAFSKRSVRRTSA